MRSTETPTGAWAWAETDGTFRQRAALALAIGFSQALAPTGATQTPSHRAADLPPLTASANLDRFQPHGDTRTIDVTLSRALNASEGELVLVVDDVDVTALSERTASRITYRPTTPAHPTAKSEVVLYRRIGGAWNEIRRFSVRAAQAVHLPGLGTVQSATVGNKGQIAEGRSTDLPVPDRRTFQDFVLNAGLGSSSEKNGWVFTTQSNYMGVTRREEALRFAVRGRDAPMLDLASYAVGLRRSNTTLSMGHVSFGTSRHLVNGFSTRGTTVGWNNGASSLSIGALSDSSQVGWSDPVGVERPSNRLFGASLGREVIATHPGALRLEATYLDGSKLPQASFTQGAIVDAEKSAGGTVQLSAALPNQRVRFSSGYTRSRFENPARDAELLGTSGVARPTAVTRDALFAEGSAALLQNDNWPFGRGVPTSVTIGGRHERVDPLYRSVAATTAADRQESAADATVSLGTVTGQFTRLWNHDNVGRVSSVLTTNGHGATASLAVPIGSIGDMRRHQVWFPTLTIAHNRTRQFATGLPSNGGFRDQDLANQLSVNTDVAALWQSGRMRVTLRANRSAQDNRQPLREAADFAAGVHAISVGTTFGTRGDAAFDLGDEFQTSKERNETTRVRRATLNGSYRPWVNTNLLGALSLVRSRPPAGGATVNGDQRIELSQNLNLWAGPGGSRGQLFVRYARTTSLLPDFTSLLVPAPRLDRQQWTIASGLNLRLF